MSPVLNTVTHSIAAGLRRRSTSADPSNSTSLPIYGIILIVVGVLALFTIVGIAVYLIRRRRLNPQNDNEDGWRDSFIPNNFKVVGGIYSLSKSASRAQSQDAGVGGQGGGAGAGAGGRSNAPSPYQPTTEYGQYRPPLPKPAFSKPHNPANLVRHARDKSLPLVPANLP